MKSFRLSTVALFAAATLPRLAHRGMFVDGVTYASVARNLAEGRGRFWSPSYTATLYPQFHEHPPLGFWLQSLWFRVFGDHLFVERLFTLVVAIGTAVLISLIWRRLNSDEGPSDGGRNGPADERVKEVAGLQASVYQFRENSPAKDLSEARNLAPDLDWLPVLLWIAVPVVSWAIVGNLLETTVALFTTGAVLAALIAVGRTASLAVAAAGWSVLSGLCIVAAVLTKGPVGLFPLVAPVAFLLLPNGRRAWPTLVMQWTTVTACALLLSTSASARASLSEYLIQQVMAALAGEREVSSSITIVKTLLQGVLLPMAVAGGLAIAAARRFVLPSPAARRRGLLLFLMGLAGTLPIMASAKQAGHYLVPAVPLFALAAALVIGPTVRVAVEAAIDRLGARRLHAAMNIVSVLVTLVTVGASVSPAIGRDRERLANLDAVASSVPRDQTVGICPETNSDWGLHAWFERRFHVSLDAADGQRREWFLQTAGVARDCVPPTTCAAATDPRRQLVLMKCRRSD